MGRQFSLILGPADQAAFDEVLKGAGGLAILRARPRSSQPERLETTVVGQYGAEDLRLILARADDLRSVAFEPIKGRAEFSCSPTEAPIVEFDRCFISKDVIRPGRLYFVPRYLDEAGNNVDKPKPFLDWADKLFRRAKASLTKIEGDIYAGPDAIKLAASVPISRV